MPACAGRGSNVCAKLGDFHPRCCASALAGPVRACARQRAALPIPWMGPGLAAGLGGSTCTARAAAREQVCPSARMHMPMPACQLLPVVLILFATHLRSPSARHLEPSRPPWRSWRSSDHRYSWAAHAPVLVASCGARMRELCSDGCRCPAVSRFTFRSHVSTCFGRFSGPRWTQVMILGVLEPPNTCPEWW